VVDNRAGAGGNIGGQLVAQAPPDGTMLLVCAFSCSTVPSLYAKPPYDTRLLAPVIMIGTVPSVMVVPAGLPVQSLREFAAYAKSHPVNYASSGVGSSPHLVSELLAQMAGIEMIHVPYRGAGQVSADLIAGRVQLYFDNLPAALPNIRQGTERALLVAQEHRAAVAPDIPTVAEAGMSELLITPWFGIFAPPGTSEPVLERLNAAYGAALAEEAVTRRMKELGVEVAGGDYESLVRFVQADVAKWGAIIRDRRISSD
jgi:tripartite-type tricarboxylate transporter receptor subunit TctC